MPKVSAVMTVYNGKRFIEESIESIRVQTFNDWEFIIINEFGSDDGTKEIIERYAEIDLRIVFIQNENRLGIAESLNRGVNLAKGEYIARVDVDDPSYPERFEKQVSFLNTHLDVGFCGTLQNSLNPDGLESILYVATDYNSLKAEMLFGCQISHSSVMFRKELFAKNNWYYDNKYLAEDYELWTRITNKIKYENINEALVYHRLGFGGISILRGENLHVENRRTIASLLERDFDIDESKYDIMLFSTWRNNIKKHAIKKIKDFIVLNYILFREMEKNNEINKCFNYTNKGLTKALCKRWQWALENTHLNHDLFNRNGIELPYFLEHDTDSFKTSLTRQLFINGEKNPETIVDADIVERIKTRVDIIKEFFFDRPKILIYGIGQQCKEFINILASNVSKDYYFNIVAFSETDPGRWGEKIEDIPVISPSYIKTYDYDAIIISTDAYYEDIFEILTNKLNVDIKKIMPPFVLDIILNIDDTFS